jgi:hypothetical protein
MGNLVAFLVIRRRDIAFLRRKAANQPAEKTNSFSIVGYCRLNTYRARDSRLNLLTVTVLFSFRRARKVS